MVLIQYCRSYGFNNLDIKQRGIGDCWFLASLASLSLYPDHLSWTIQRYLNIYQNAEYEFKFYHVDEWITIKIDDMLPGAGRNIQAVSGDSGELWCAYAEKAYAKKYGGYDDIKGGKGCEAMVDLTGGFALYTKLEISHAEEAFKFLYENQDRLIMTAAIFGTGVGEAAVGNGLYSQHEYSLMRLEMVRDKDDNIVRLVRIRNPWGTAKEFTGEWSDNSTLWNTLPSPHKEELYAKKADGAFWMSYEDWIANFDEYTFCLLPRHAYDGFVGEQTVIIYSAVIFANMVTQVFTKYQHIVLTFFIKNQISVGKIILL